MIYARMIQHPVTGTGAPFCDWRLLFRIDHSLDSASVFYDLSGQPTIPPPQAVPVLPKTLSHSEMALAKLGLRRIAQDWRDEVAWIHLSGTGKEQAVSQVWSTAMGIERGAQ